MTHPPVELRQSRRDPRAGSMAAARGRGGGAGGEGVMGTAGGDARTSVWTDLVPANPTPKNGYGGNFMSVLQFTKETMSLLTLLLFPPQSTVVTVIAGSTWVFTGDTHRTFAARHQRWKAHRWDWIFATHHSKGAFTCRTGLCHTRGSSHSGTRSRSPIWPPVTSTHAGLHSCSRTHKQGHGCSPGAQKAPS